ncbi:MAG: ABC transporter ATP-binding protein [Clostridium sp.]|nr:ABC transporter ATP-binding protein [Clostridium sp.]
MENHFLNISNLAVEYTSDGSVIHAVNHVDLSVDHGETLGLVGETGAGKTTIAKSILGILPDRSAKIQSGEIVLGGQDLLRLSEKEMLRIRGKRISMIFQDPMTALNPVMTIGGQITEALRLHEELGLHRAKEKACDMLEMVGIPGERFNEYPHQFSGGMKQRVVIAMALACSPELLLADEPTSALDVTVQAQVLEMIDNLKTKYNMAMILITHDLGVVAETCQKVAVIYAGEIVEYGTKEEVFRRPLHPYTRGLFGSLPVMNSGKPRLCPIPGMPPNPSALPPGCKFAPRCPHKIAECENMEEFCRQDTGGHYCRCVMKGRDDKWQPY